MHTAHELLAQLGAQSLEDLSQGEYINLATIARANSQHPQQVKQILSQLHAILTAPTLSNSKPSISMDPIFKKWGSDCKTSLSLCSGDVIELLGRINSGKSYLLNRMILECLKADREVIFLDGNYNLPSLLNLLYSEGQPPTFRYFSFRGQAQLSMYLQALASHLQKKSDCVLVIDGLARWEETEGDTGQTANSIEFKAVQKFKALLISVNPLGSIIYASRPSNHNSLFYNSYKQEQHRPRCVGLGAKLWDSIANKTLCVDYSRVGSREIWRIQSTKSLDCQMMEMIRRDQQ